MWDKSVLNGGEEWNTRVDSSTLISLAGFLRRGGRVGFGDMLKRYRRKDETEHSGQILPILERK